MIHAPASPPISHHSLFQEEPFEIMQVPFDNSLAEYSQWSPVDILSEEPVFRPGAKIVSTNAYSPFQEEQD
jgi:hypothetical protein